MLFVAAALTILHPTPARATTTCNVTSTADSGDGTLRQKIGDATCDVITFIVPGPITLTSGQLTIWRNLTITGPGADKMTVQRMDGSPNFRIFRVIAGATAVISGITITKGYIDGDGHGGGIENLGILRITDSTLEYNAARDTEGGGSSGLGGAIANFNELTADKVTFRGNNAEYGGGGGFVSLHIATVTNSTFSNHGCSGAVSNFSGTVTVTNSTIKDSEGCYHVYSVGVTTIKNTILQNGSYPGSGWGWPNCFAYAGGVFIDGGGNLSHDSSCPAAYHSLDPMLGPLANNGGPTQTMALLPGSPAIDTAANCPATDQRGVSRPQGSACDIGAYELIQRAGPVFSGFLAPVSNPPTVNTVKAGQAVPVKFNLGGDWGLNIIAAGYPASRQVPCPLSSGASAITETQTAGNSSLAYDSVTQTYTYVWKTDKDWANTCRELVVVLGDLNRTTRTATFSFNQ